MSWWMFDSWIEPEKSTSKPRVIEFIGGPFDGRTLAISQPEPLLSLLVSAPVIDEDYAGDDGDVNVTSIATYLLLSLEGHWAYRFTGSRDPYGEPSCGQDRSEP